MKQGLVSNNKDNVQLKFKVFSSRDDKHRTKTI
jgi:hypothetical protein